MNIRSNSDLTPPPQRAEECFEVAITRVPAERSAIPATHVRFRGRDLVIAVREPQSVLEPTDFGLTLLAAVESESVLPVAGRTVLDVGCGSGIYTVAMMAAGAARVTALDLNPDCRVATAANIALNDLSADRVEYVTADISTFRSPTRFQIVVANPPHLPDLAALPHDGIRAALVGGTDGRAIYDALIAQADRLLAADGVLVLAHSSLTDVDRTKAEMSGRGFACATAATALIPLPLAGLDTHREAFMHRLTELRAAGQAQFDNDHLTVHTLLFTRTGATA